MFLLADKRSYISARMLATKLGLKYTSKVERLGGRPPIIRYGNSQFPFSDDTQYNSPEVIRLCADSIAFGQWCRENAFQAPLYTPFDVQKQYAYPFLLRNRWHHGGKDVKIIQSAADLAQVERPEAMFHVAVIETTSEIGIHIVLGQVIRIFKKQNPADDGVVKIRSQWRGYHYSLVEDLNERYRVAQEIGLQLFAQLGLAFGRIDMGYNSRTKTYTIFEVNTAPGLNLNTAELYATQLRQVVNV